MAGKFPVLNVKKHQALFRATELISVLEMGTKALSHEEYTTIMNHVCRALSLSLEQGLEEAVVALGASSAHGAIASDVGNILMEMEAFLSFLNFEKEILRECGLSKPTIDDLMESIVRGREILVKEGRSVIAGSFNSAEVLEGIKRLQKSACENASSMTRRIGSEKDIYDDQVFALQVSGVSLLGANLTVLAISAGVATPFSVLSSGLGGLMLTYERLFMKDPTK